MTKAHAGPCPVVVGDDGQKLDMQRGPMSISCHPVGSWVVMITKRTTIPIRSLRVPSFSATMRRTNCPRQQRGAES